MDGKAILQAMAGDIWAIRPDALETMATLAIQGVPPEAARKRGRPSGISGSVAVLPVHGHIQQRADILMQFFGGTSTEGLGAAFDSLVADPSVGAIVLDVDSPGGSVAGVQELGDKIFAARGTKPIVAVANSEAASAAFWLASAADQLVVTPSGMVGSIGVVALHTDLSQMFAEAGVKHTIITAGEFKAEANPLEPLTDEAHAEIQARVNDYYKDFVGAVARNRNVTSGTVAAEFGQGRMVRAKDAVRVGMADSVGTLEGVVGQLLSRAKAKPQRTAALADGYRDLEALTG